MHRLSQLSAPALAGVVREKSIRAGMLSGIIHPILGGQIAFCVDRYTEASVMEQIDRKHASAIVEKIKKICEV